MNRSIAFVYAACLATTACGPERVNAGGEGETGETGETGEPELAPGHWLLYTASTPGIVPIPGPSVALRAVDLGHLDQGQIGAPVELFDSTEYRMIGPTPWGGYAVELDDAYMLVGLDADGQIELISGVPEGVPAKARRPKFSADGSVALFAGEYSSPPDNFYWARFEHGRPTVGGALGPMPSQGSNVYWISPSGSYGVVDQREEGGTESRLHRFEFDAEPGELVPLLPADEEPVEVAALFDEHLFAWVHSGVLHAGAQLVLVDMSEGEAGERYPVSPTRLGVNSIVWFAPTGDAVVYLDIGYTMTEKKGTLWRVEIVDGVPTPAVQLSAAGELVSDGNVHFPGRERVGWRSLADQFATLGHLRWTDFVAGELGSTQSLVDDVLVSGATWSPDGRWVAWRDDTLAVDERTIDLAALTGPERGVAKALDQLGASGLPTWVGERVIYPTAESTRLWSATLGDAGPGPSTPLDPAVLGPISRVSASVGVTGHDAALLRVVASPDTPGHLQLLQLGPGPLAATRIDDDSQDPREQRVLGQILR